VIATAPAVLDSAKNVYPSLSVVIFAVPAVLPPWNSVYPAVLSSYRQKLVTA
jgi:hypothetical protein